MWLSAIDQGLFVTSLLPPREVNWTSAADAFGAGLSFGIGGWFSFLTEPSTHDCWWFSEKSDMNEMPKSLDLGEDAQKIIACFEMLAQQALIRCMGGALAGSSFPLQVHQQSDNMAVVATLGREFTTSKPLCYFTQSLALEAIRHRCQVQPTFRPGERNEWADGLSRGHEHVASLFHPSRRVRLAPAELLRWVCD